MSLSRIGFWLFALLSVLIALVSLRVLVAPVEVVMDHMAHYLPTVPMALYGHIVLAPLALMLAPLQLWWALRVRRPTFHRWTGRVYGVAILGAGLSSLWLLPQFEGSTWALVGFAALAVLWIFVTAVGVIRARQRNFSAHRQWMMRSVALTFAAVTLRIYMAPMIAGGWTVVETYDVTAWAAWLPNLIAVEMWIRRGAGRVAMV